MRNINTGDVVEMAIDKLEAEGKFYDREVAVLDTIDNVARRTFTRTVYADSLIRVGSLRDTPIGSGFEQSESTGLCIRSCGQFDD